MNNHFIEFEILIRLLKYLTQIEMHEMALDIIS